jgi:hypothetical protein
MIFISFKSLYLFSSGCNFQVYFICAMIYFKCTQATIMSQALTKLGFESIQLPEFCSQNSSLVVKEIFGVTEYV